jgi:hypothetical protein
VYIPKYMCIYVYVYLCVCACVRACVTIQQPYINVSHSNRASAAYTSYVAVPYVNLHVERDIASSPCELATVSTDDVQRLLRLLPNFMVKTTLYMHIHKLFKKYTLVQSVYEYMWAYPYIQADV